MTQQNDVIESDVLVSLWSDVRSQRERLGRLAEPTPKRVLTELSDTGLSVIEDMLGYFVQFRQYVSESLADVDARISSLEEASEPALLDADSAEMILKLAATCEAFVRIVKESSASMSDDAKAKVDEALELVEETRAWVTANLDEDLLSEDDDAEDENDETPAESAS